MNKVLWSTLAKKNFRNNIDYLFQNWTIKEVENFVHKIEVLKKNLAENTSLCPKSKIFNLRKCYIDKNNSLIYLFENNTIFIITIINNNSSHSY